MHAALLLLGLLVIAGCDTRSSSLPKTEQWVAFHCPPKNRDKPVFMVEMPGKPRLAPDSVYRRMKSALGDFDAYEYKCGSDGEFAALAAEIEGEFIGNPLDNDAIQEYGREFAARIDGELTECRPFLYDDKYPAIDLAGAQKRGIGGNFRIRMINYNQYLVMLVVTGRTKVVREPEVSYFFDSLLLYK